MRLSQFLLRFFFLSYYFFHIEIGDERTEMHCYLYIVSKNAEELVLYYDVIEWWWWPWQRTQQENFNHAFILWLICTQPKSILHNCIWIRCRNNVCGCFVHSTHTHTHTIQYLLNQYLICTKHDTKCIVVDGGAHVKYGFKKIAAVLLHFDWWQFEGLTVESVMWMNILFMFTLLVSSDSTFATEHFVIRTALTKLWPVTIVNSRIIGVTLHSIRRISN